MLLKMEHEGVTLPHAQYALNDKQLINALPIDGNCVTSIVVEHYETQRWGPLSQLNFITQAQMINSLRLDDWDFDQYPDPEIFILNFKENG